jgi:hypothetical protein
MASPSLETANLHAALGDMSLQSASAATTPSPTALPARELIQDNSLSQDKATDTARAGSKTAPRQESAQPNTPMSISNTKPKTMEPPKKKFVYDPTSMLLPHERMAQQRPAPPPQPSKPTPFNPALYRQPPAKPNQPPVQHLPHTVIGHQQGSPPPYTAVSPSNGQGHPQNQSHIQMGMPTRAAPPLPPAMNGRHAPGPPKPDIMAVNRNTGWVDPDAVDPLQQSPVVKDDPASDDESEDEEDEGMSASDSRGKKRLRSEGTNSVAGSVDNRGTRRGVGAIGRASLSDWEVVETLGKPLRLAVCHCF